MIKQGGKVYHDPILLRNASPTMLKRVVCAWWLITYNPNQRPDVDHKICCIVEGDEAVAACECICREQYVIVWGELNTGGGRIVRHAAMMAGGRRGECTAWIRVSSVRIVTEAELWGYVDAVNISTRAEIAQGMILPQVVGQAQGGTIDGAGQSGQPPNYTQQQTLDILGHAVDNLGHDWTSLDMAGRAQHKQGGRVGVDGGKESIEPDNTECSSGAGDPSSQIPLF